MVLPSSAMRVVSSSSDTTSSPRSGFSSNGGGTRRGVPRSPGIGGTLVTRMAGAGGVPCRRLAPQPAGGAGDPAPLPHLGGPHRPAGQRRRGGGQRGGVGRVQPGRQGGEQVGVVGGQGGGAGKEGGDVPAGHLVEEG